jgi:aldehyde dehydrogenase (NAD+)
MYVGGEWVDAGSGDYFESDNPYLGEPWALIPRGTAADADRAIRAAHAAFTSGEWPRLTASRRGALLRRLGDLIIEKSAELAEIEVRDNGKLYAEMSAQCAYMAQWYHYYGGLADKIEGSVLPTDKPETFNYTRYEPLGVVVAIIPWNSPLLLMAWKLAPALAAGNTVVVKPSEFTSASALEFMKLVKRPASLRAWSTSSPALAPMSGRRSSSTRWSGRWPLPDRTRPGQRVYESAARGMKRVSMELGGKSPNIVFEDADLDNAIKGVISGIFAATGQTCIAGSRLLVQQSITTSSSRSSSRLRRPRRWATR